MDALGALPDISVHQGRDSSTAPTSYLRLRALGNLRRIGASTCEAAQQTSKKSSAAEDRQDRSSLVSRRSSSLASSRGDPDSLREWTSAREQQSSIDEPALPARSRRIC